MRTLATESTPPYTLPTTMWGTPSAAVTSIASIVRGSADNSRSARASGSPGRASWRAKSSPRPAGRMPRTAPVPASAPARPPTMPSPPAAITTSPFFAASRARPPACSRLRLYSTATSAPASRSRRATGISRAAGSLPAAGFTTAVNDRMFSSCPGLTSGLCAGSYGVRALRGAAGRRSEGGGVHDPLGVEPRLDGAQRRDAARAGLAGVPVAVVDAAPEVVGVRAARLDDRVVDRGLRPPPALQRLLALGRDDREVERGARRVDVGHVAHDHR